MLFYQEAFLLFLLGGGEEVLAGRGELYTSGSQDLAGGFQLTVPLLQSLLCLCKQSCQLQSYEHLHHFNYLFCSTNTHAASEAVFSQRNRSGFTHQRVYLWLISILLTTSKGSGTLCLRYAGENTVFLA